MKASTRCLVEVGNATSPSMRIDRAQGAGSKVDESEEEKTLKAEPSQQPSPPATPSSDHDNDDDLKDASIALHEVENDADSTEAGKPPPDPLQWFGILVPRELRSAQQSFSQAVTGPVTGAVSAARVMREVEAEIRRVRKAIKKAEKASGV